MHSARLALATALAAALLAPLDVARAQDADRNAVLAAVQKVFDAMRTRDTVLLHSAFDTSARLVGVSTRGAPAVNLNTVSQFAAGIMRAPEGDLWHERMYEPEVRIDGPIAQVWGYYTFHRNATFSHCGVDAFMLLRVGTEWKITQLSDSRRTADCTHTAALSK